MKKILTFLLVFCLYGLNAQTIDDVLKVSYQDYEGTARFAAMGGAFGALGGDISGISVNPAGLAVFRKPHVSVTSSLNHIYNNSNYMGIQTGDSRLHVGLSSIGTVAILTNQNKMKWNLGITYMKKTNFNRRTYVQNTLNERSIIHYFSEKANKYPDFFTPDYLDSYTAFYDYNPLDWDVVMAYGTYLIDWDKDNNNYYGVLDKDDRVYQQINSLSLGSSGELTFDLGLNYNDNFYAGILVGMTSMNYSRNTVYGEYAHENNISDFEQLIYNTNLKISGFGINYKIGFIYKPFQSIRFGFAFHSPDYFMYPYKNIENENYMRVMDNLYSASLEARYKNDSPYLDGPGEDYYLFFNRIKTPYKAVGSFAFVIGNMGLVSMDCEYVDYSRIKLKGSEPTDWFNTEIKKYFKSTVNLRFGAELWVKNLALRIGYMQNQSPDKDYDMSRKTYSAGFGYKLSRRFNIDFAYVQTNTTDHYTHYENANKIIENLKNRRLSITLGWILDYSSFY